MLIEPEMNHITFDGGVKDEPGTEEREFVDVIKFTLLMRRIIIGYLRTGLVNYHLN